MSKSHLEQVIGSSELQPHERVIEVIHYARGRIDELTKVGHSHYHMKMITEFRELFGILGDALAEIEVNQLGDQPMSHRMAQDLKWQLAALKVKIQDQLNLMGKNRGHSQEFIHQMTTPPEDSLDNLDELPSST